MSLGGPVDAALDAAVRRSIADGVTYCVSAGNSAANVSTQSPADVAGAITVGATEISDTFASFSNFGAGVDISGPSVNITSSWFTTNAATNTISGASMSSPHVAGAVALYLEANPATTPASVATAMTTNATTNVIKSIPSGTANRLLYSLIGAPAVPALSSLANAATSVAVPVTLSWVASSGATSYQVQVSTSATFSPLFLDRPGVTTTSTSVTGLATSTVYYWRVSAFNAGGSGACSAARSFTPAPTVPARTETATTDEDLPAVERPRRGVLK